MLLFNISFRIFYISSCSSGTDDIFKEIWSYNPSLIIRTLQKLCVIDRYNRFHNMPGQPLQKYIT